MTAEELRAALEEAWEAGADYDDQPGRSCAPARAAAIDAIMTRLTPAVDALIRERDEARAAARTLAEHGNECTVPTGYDVRTSETGIKTQHYRGPCGTCDVCRALAVVEGEASEDGKQAAKEAEACAEEVLSIVFAFDRNDSRRDDIRRLAERVRGLAARAPAQAAPSEEEQRVAHFFDRLAVARAKAHREGREP